jgi:hypothetical protein
MLSPNTLRLLKSLLDGQQIDLRAPREEIDAVLVAKDELDAAVAAAEETAAK